METVEIVHTDIPLRIDEPNGKPKSKPIAELKRAPRPKVSNTSMLLRRSARDFAIEYTTRRSPATSRVRSITITFQDRFHWVGDVMVTADTHVA